MDKQQLRTPTAPSPCTSNGAVPEDTVLMPRTWRTLGPAWPTLSTHAQTQWEGPWLGMVWQRTLSAVTMSRRRPRVGHIP